MKGNNTIARKAPGMKAAGAAEGLQVKAGDKVKVNRTASAAQPEVPSEVMSPAEAGTAASDTAAMRRKALLDRKRTIDSIPTLSYRRAPFGDQAPPQSSTEGLVGRAASGGLPKGPWPWGDYETRYLRIMQIAVEQFWAPYDPSDSKTAPTNAAVIAALEAHGVTPTLAEHMATILRADGLKRGRRKK